MFEREYELIRHAKAYRGNLISLPGLLPYLQERYDPRDIGKTQRFLKLLGYTSVHADTNRVLAYLFNWHLRLTSPKPIPIKQPKQPPPLTKKQKQWEDQKRRANRRM